jgi:predicted site-specific integrase-resolvase
VKLSSYAKKNGVCYQTAYNWWKNGYLKGKQLPSGTIIVEEEKEINENLKKCVLYTRVSTSEQKEHIDRQLERVRNYAVSKGYQIINEYKEIASGLNDNRKFLNKILNDNSFDVLIVEHKDRLTRFGFSYIEHFLNYKKQTIEVINLSENSVMDDFVSIVTCFCSKIYGRRGNQNRVKKIIEEVKNIEE